jgi:hypothetical protein
MKTLIRLICAALLPCLISSCDGASTRSMASGGNAQDKPMKASTTYLYLLRKTPFFTALTTGQLRWVIDHSREWEAQAGATVDDCSESSADLWILLDGRWQVEHDGRTWPSGHADPGKWFSSREAGSDPGACRLVTTEHSYVMRIARVDFAAMIAQGFAFEPHIEAGETYYRTIFGR